MKRKSIINTYQNGGSKEVKYGTPEYKEAYDQNKLASVNPYTGQLQGKDLPAFTVEAKDTRIVDAVNRGRGEFAENYMLPAAKFLGSFTPAGPAIGLMDAYESYRKGDTGSAILGAGLEALPYGLKYAARAGKGIYKGLKHGFKEITQGSPIPGYGGRRWHELTKAEKSSYYKNKASSTDPAKTIKTKHGTSNLKEVHEDLGDLYGQEKAVNPKSDKENLQNLLDHLEDVNKKMEDNIKTGANIDLTDDAGKLENLLDQGGQDALSRSIKAFRQQQADNFGTAMQQLASHGKPRTTPGSLSFNTSLGDKARQLLGDEFNAMQKYTASGLSTEDALDLASKEVMKSGKYTAEEAQKIAAMGLEDASKGRSGPFDKFNLLESLKGVEESSKVGGGLLSKKNTLRGNIEDSPLLGSYQGRNQFGVFGDKAPDLIGDVSKNPAVKMMMENPEKYKEALNAASGTYLKKKLERGANYFQKYEKGKPYTGLDAFQDISPYAKGGKKKSILNCM